MTTKLLYLDDAGQQDIRPFVQAVNGSGKVEITLEHPALYVGKIDALIVRLKDFDGLILDWRLDEIVMQPDAEGKKYNFRAGALAQEIHSRTAEGMIHAMPMILWSATQKYKGSFKGDFTAQDLFDKKYTKEDVAEDGAKVALELEALSDGYKKISQNSNAGLNMVTLLGCEQKPDYLDIRVKEKFSSGPHSIHEVADFLLNKLIEVPGLLINDELLSARLGIDKQNSTGWSDLVELLKPFLYNGPFSSAWSRWWADGIEEEWWFATIKAEHPLSSLSAKDRIAKISEVTKITELNVQEPIKDGYHDKFYTICEETRMPLDPIDGIIIDEPQPEPWQDRRYISLEVALQGTSETNHPHPTEKERLKVISEGIENKG